MKLIVWLWNPWQQYKATRHNIWVTMLEKFLDKEQKWKLKYDNKWNAEMLTTELYWNKVIFCAPQTYMNASWESVWPLAQFYKISPENILVIHDEIDFVVGRIAIKKWGSAAWHNWLRSIISKLWTKDFWRIRIWVGRPATSNMVADYVLSKFKPNEKEIMEEKFGEISDFISWFLKDVHKE